VDDEPDILDALARTLRTAKCRFVLASSGREALGVLSRERVDLVISDIDMPDMTGLELLARARQHHPHAARVVLTGVASLETAVRAINDGEVQRFLTKPWEKEELRRVVSELLAARGAGTREPPALGLGESDAPPLSPRERQTLAELLTGAKEKEIAQRMGVSPHTAHQYVKAVYRRYAVASRMELVVKLGPPRAPLQRRGPADAAVARPAPIAARTSAQS